VARSRTAYRAPSVLDYLTSGDTHAANDKTAAPAFGPRCNIWSLQECAWPRKCIEHMHVAASLAHSEFDAEHQNWGSASPSCVFNVLPAHEELSAPMGHIYARGRITIVLLSNLKWICVHCRPSQRPILMKRRWFIWAWRTDSRSIGLIVEVSSSENAHGYLALYSFGYCVYPFVGHCRIWLPVDTGVDIQDFWAPYINVSIVDI
jgi:hypothetical protein